MPRGAKPGERRGGRAKGTPNKTTVAVKEALLEAFERGGGVDALVVWMKEERGEFYKLWSKLLPQDISSKVEITGDRAKQLEEARQRVARSLIEATNVCSN